MLCKTNWHEIVFWVGSEGLGFTIAKISRMSVSMCFVCAGLPVVSGSPQSSRLGFLLPG